MKRLHGIGIEAGRGRRQGVSERAVLMDTYAGLGIRAHGIKGGRELRVRGSVDSIVGE